MKIKKHEESTQKKTGSIFFLLIIFFIVTFVIVIFLLYPNPPTVIEIGDCAEVEYIGTFTSNGTVFTTTYTDVVQKTGGGPRNIFINPNQNLKVPKVCGATYVLTSVPPEAIRALVGMKEGETKNFTLSPAQAYGIWDTGLASRYGLQTYPINEIWETTVEDIPTDEFLYYFPNVEIIEGTRFDYWDAAFGITDVLAAHITKIANDTVTFTMLPVHGTTFSLPALNLTATILVTDDTTFTIHTDIPLNHTFTFQDLSTEESLYGKVIAVNETEATIAFNNIAPSKEFVDQFLTFEFKVVSITKTTR